jgi:hypothetical protein
MKMLGTNPMKAETLLPQPSHPGTSIVVSASFTAGSTTCHGTDVVRRILQRYHGQSFLNAHLPQVHRTLLQQERTTTAGTTRRPHKRVELTCCVRVAPVGWPASLRSFHTSPTFSIPTADCNVAMWDDLSQHACFMARSDLNF